MTEFKKRDSFLKHPITTITLIFISWRIIIEAVEWWAVGRIGDANYPYPVAVAGKEILASWARWDSVYYIDMAISGYKNGPFFPLFSWLIKGVSYLVDGHILIAGHIVTNLMALGSCIVLYYLAKLNNGDDKQNAMRSIYYLLIFPVAFILVAQYTESTFLFFSLLAFYFYQRKHPLAAGLFGGLAAWVRTPGMFIYPALALDSLIVSWRPFRLRWNWREQISLLVIPISSLLLFAYNKFRFGMAFEFISAQTDFGRHAGLNIFSTIYQNIAHFWMNPMTSENVTNAFNYLLFFTLFVVALYFIIRYSKSVAFSVLAIISFVVPAFSGTFISMNRFLLVLFPIYIILPKLIKNGSLAEKCYSFACIMLLSFLMIMFTNSHWIG